MNLRLNKRRLESVCVSSGHHKKLIESIVEASEIIHDLSTEVNDNAQGYSDQTWERLERAEDWFNDMTDFLLTMKVLYRSNN